MGTNGTIHVRVRTTTRDKLDVVAKRNDWTRVVTAEKAADALLEKLEREQKPARRRRAVTA